MTDKKKPETEETQHPKAATKRETELEILERLGLGDGPLAQAYRRAQEEAGSGVRRPIEVVAVTLKSKRTPEKKAADDLAKRQKDDSAEQQ